MTVFFLEAVLGAISIASGDAEVSMAPGYVEHVLLYLMLVAGSGEGKSAVFNYFMAPIIERQKRLSRQWEEQAREARQNGEKPEPKTRLYVGNTSTEKLAMRMAESGGRLSILADEGRGITSILAGRYSKQGSDGELDLYLYGWAGSYYQADRITRDEVEIESTRLNICVGVQPDAFEQFIANENMKVSGLLARFLRACL
jgi:hypothetical protein